MPPRGVSQASLCLQACACAPVSTRQITSARVGRPRTSTPHVHMNFAWFQSYSTRNVRTRSGHPPEVASQLMHPTFLWACAWRRAGRARRKLRQRSARRAKVRLVYTCTFLQQSTWHPVGSSFRRHTFFQQSTTHPVGSDFFTRSACMPKTANGLPVVSKMTTVGGVSLWLARQHAGRKKKKMHVARKKESLFSSQRCSPRAFFFFCGPRAAERVTRPRRPWMTTWRTVKAGTWTSVPPSDPFLPLPGDVRQPS